MHPDVLAFVCSTVKPHKAAPFAAPRGTLPSDVGTTRRLQYPRPPSAFESGTLRYPGTYVPPPTQPFKKSLSVNVKLIGAGMDGTSVPVTVRSTGTVAELITSAVENLRKRECRWRSLLGAAGGRVRVW